jgi:hypothetical protein
LRRKVKPQEAVRERTRDRDDFGRIPREAAKEEEEDTVMREREDRERGVQIKGEDGDVEVEY